MATFIGNEGVAQIGANNVAEVTAFTYEESADMVDDSACGDQYKTYKAGRKDGGGNLTCWWDPTDTNGQLLLVPGAEVDLTLYPAGNAAGNGKLSGTVTVEKVTMDHSDGSIVGRSFSYKGALVPELVS